MIKIKPSPKNTNKHTEDGMQLLKTSIDKVGVLESISVTKEGTIISGHARSEIFNSKGMVAKEIHLAENEYPVIVTDIEDNTKEYYEAQILANTTANKNFNLDAELIEEIAVEYDIDIEEVGVEVEEVENETFLEAKEDDYDTTPPSEPITVLGDLYEIGEHRLLCGDSTDSDQVAKLMNGQKADMVFTDPPYGMAYESNAWDSKKSEVKQKRTDTQILNDENTNVGQDALNLIPLFLENNRHFYIWCRWDCFNDFKEVCQNIGKIKSVVVWDKGGPGLGDLKGSYGDSEWAIFGMIGRRELKERQNGVWQVNRMKGLQMQHPTQKPLEICERGINNSTNENELILDLFSGSGSTMVASHQLKRKCYGMELDPKYCDVIIKRMLKLDDTLKVKRNGIDCTNEFKE
jgi:DNA modification methylase